MNRVDRLFGIVTLLESRKYVTAEKIAERYEISIRTVYRDIKALIEQGIPISFEPFRGYFLVEGYFLSPVAFTTEEANALLLMDSLVAGFTDESIRKYYSAALNKIKAILKYAQKDQLEQLHQKISVQVPKCFQNNYEYLTIMQQAISTRRILKLDYKNREEIASHREVAPIGLIFYAFSWHLIAWCHLRAAYRDFKVSRVQHLQLTDQSFQQRAHLTLQDYLQQLPVDY